MALFSNAAVSLSSPAVRDGMHSWPSYQPAFTSLWHTIHCTSTPFSNSNVTFDAGLISLGTKEPSAEQKEHTVVDAATRSNLRHGSQGAATECLNTSTHSGRSHCFGLPMVGRAHVRKLEEGQSSKDAQ